MVGPQRRHPVNWRVATLRVPVNALAGRDDGVRRESIKGRFQERSRSLQVYETFLRYGADGRRG